MNYLLIKNIMNEKIIIDTDPWVDDALAIMYAIKNGCNIIWLTTIFWNSDIDNTTNNALKILSIMWSNIPVFKWESTPLKWNWIIAKSHWDWWFWWYEVEIKQSINKKTALDFITQTLENDTDVVIICLWPTTNISKLAISRPDLIKNIKQIIILWWVVWEKWNITEYAEFNVYNDPESLKKVLWLDIEKILIPINVCRKVFFNTNDFDKINNNWLSKWIKKISKQYIDYYKSNEKYWNFLWWVMYDLLATTFYTNKKLFKTKNTYIEVITQNTENIGQTIEIDNKSTNCKIVTWVDEIKLKNLFFKTMNK